MIWDHSICALPSIPCHTLVQGYHPYCLSVSWFSSFCEEQGNMTLSKNVCYVIHTNWGAGADAATCTSLKIDWILEGKTTFKNPEIQISSINSITYCSDAWICFCADSVWIETSEGNLTLHFADTIFQMYANTENFIQQILQTSGCRICRSGKWAMRQLHSLVMLQLPKVILFPLFSSGPAPDGYDSC